MHPLFANKFISFAREKWKKEIVEREEVLS